MVLPLSSLILFPVSSIILRSPFIEFLKKYLLLYFEILNLSFDYSFYLVLLCLEILFISVHLKITTAFNSFSQPNGDTSSDSHLAAGDTVLMGKREPIITS